MSFISLLLLAVGVSMDAFAVAVCKGLVMETAGFRKSATVGLYFGGFQAAMPLLGYAVGAQFAAQIKAFDHWVAFALLAAVGGKMLWEAFRREECEAEKDCLSFKTMLPLAVATSIDALAVGLSFAFLEVSIGPAIALIGITTFCLSMVGVKAGTWCGPKLKSYAEVAGGVILVLMGVKILLEHTVLA